MVSSHAVADKLLVEWLSRENYENFRNRMQVIRDSFLARRILLIESHSKLTNQTKTVF